MKNILKIDITTYIIILLSLISGNFKEIITLYIIIFFHELGHYIMLKKYHKRIIKITIYPFGGITKYNSLINHKIKEELLIASAGIINQLILIPFIILFYKLNLINTFTYNLFFKNNLTLLIFNLLPIIGLDGEKIIHYTLEYFFSFNLSNKIILIISLITTIIFFIYSYTLKINTLIIITFLIYNL